MFIILLSSNESITPKCQVEMSGFGAQLDKLSDKKMLQTILMIPPHFDVYLSFDVNDPISETNARTTMESCIADIQSWIMLNCLKLNGNKTEFLHFQPDHKYQCLDVSTAIGGPL